mmetsp:Transcript_111541/g.315475  ORF Transcript_111541/g.315475 Transcript_111541/m.315475 type:complete len:214 (+) Transcript_111541:246-887(+)
MVSAQVPLRHALVPAADLKPVRLDVQLLDGLIDAHLLAPQRAITVTASLPPRGVHNHQPGLGFAIAVVVDHAAAAGLPAAPAAVALAVAAGVLLSVLRPVKADAPPGCADQRHEVGAVHARPEQRALVQQQQAQAALTGGVEQQRRAVHAGRRRLGNEALQHLPRRLARGCRLAKHGALGPPGNSCELLVRAWPGTRLEAQVHHAEAALGVLE